MIRAAGVPANATLECRIGTESGAESGLASTAFSFLAPPSQRVVNFVGCACSMSDLPATGALRAQLVNPAPLVSSAAGVNGNGYSVFNVVAANDTPVAIQRFSAGQWIDSGSAFVAGGQVAVPTGAGELFRALRIAAVIPAANRCSHQRLRNDGSLAPVPLRVCLTPGTNEYRLYRRIDDGPLTLVAQGEGPYASAAVKEIGHEDSALPVSSGQAVYFAQMIDRDGNASPLAQIGQCVNLVATPPTPLLAEPKPLLEGATARVALGWFCPPVGVERFIVHIEPQETGAPAPSGSGLTPRVLAGFTAVHQVYDANLQSRVGVLARTRFLTGRVGSQAFQAGPDFSLSARIERNVRYKIWIKSVGTTGGESAPSQQFDFIWRTPPPAPVPGVEPKVPWPARGLVEATEFNPLVKAEALNHVDYPYDGGFPYPAGICIGSMPTRGTEDFEPVQPGGPFIYNPNSDPNRNQVDPHLHLHLGGGAAKQRPLPAVMYRRQVANADFPEVSGDIVQVSPLVKAIGWEFYNDDGTAAYIRDPFIGIRYRDVPNTINDSLDMFLLDTQPVIEGGAYHYYLVRFRDDGEVDSVIDAGEITIEDDF